MITLHGSDIVTCAREYLGTPHVHHGRLKGVAIDCAGLLICVGKEVGIVAQEYDFLDYAPQNDGSALEAIIREYAYEINLYDRQPGDIAIMTVYQYPQHCGFFTDVGIIHAYKTVVEHNIEDKWYKRIVKAFRLKEVLTDE